ncbi:hypothetical protein N7532_001574, partial [Penicillium argentinense]
DIMPSGENNSELLDNPSNTVKSHAFSCHFPNCNASYRRKEHLNRHETQHSQQQIFICSECGGGYGRSDTLRRHLQKRHKINKPLNRAAVACQGCHAGKTRCEGGVPCDECLRRKIQCSLNDDTGSIERQYPESSNHHTSIQHDPQQNHSGKTDRWIDLYFTAFHPSWPFVHKGSFDMRSDAPLLIQTMTCFGLWASGERRARSSAVELHDKIDLAIREQKNKWDATTIKEANSTCLWPIPTYQAILLHIIFAATLQSQETRGFDLKASLSTPYFDLLEALIRSCRRLGMFYYPNILARFNEDDLDTFVWVSIEEIKRFNLALYKVCGKVRGSGRSGNDVASLLTAGELQFPLPTNRPLWDAVGVNEWMDAIRDVRLAFLDDHCRTSWISNFAAVIDSLEL